MLIINLGSGYRLTIFKYRHLARPCPLALSVMNIKLFYLLFLCLVVMSSCEQTADDIFDEAYSLHKRNKYEEAIKKYAEVIKKNDKLQLPYYNRGICFAAQKNYAKALVDFNKVLDLHMLGSFTFEYNQNSPLAIDEARFQVSYDDALYQRAQVYYNLNDVKNSLKEFQKLVFVNYEQKSNCLLWEGSIMIRVVDSAKACYYFSKAKEFAKNEDDSLEAEKMLKLYCIPNNNIR
ncbi:hypothetical protein BH11BAC5_BH11BAC5_54540 [soil metagenome]